MLPVDLVSETEETSMKSHVVDYQIYGDDLQFVEIELDPGETVIAGGRGDDVYGGRDLFRDQDG
jgi:hypothetical protein